MKKILITLFLGGALLTNAQMLITKTADAATNGNTPHPSAMLELRSDNQGFLIPRVALTGITDITTVPNPQEGTVVICTTTHADYPGLPNTIPTLTVWDGQQWLFSYLKENVVLDLDKVRNFVFQNQDSEAVTFTSFPSSSPSFTVGSGTTGWQILINSDHPSNAGLQKPKYEFDYDKAAQRMVIDVEGIAAINNNGNGTQFGYAVGIFVEDKLVNAQKFYRTSPSGACTFHKYNIRAILEEENDSPTQILNKTAGNTYNVKVGVRALQKGESDEGTFSRLVFGADAGNRVGTNTPCGNLNAGTARSYMNVLTIEQRDHQ